MSYVMNYDSSVEKSDISKIKIGAQEFNILVEGGIIDESGVISKGKLRDAEKYLQRTVNIMFPELCDISRYNSLSDTVKFIVEKTEIEIGQREFDALVRGGIIGDDGIILKSKLKGAEEYLQQWGWNGIIPELHIPSMFDSLGDEIKLVVNEITIEN